MRLRLLWGFVMLTGCAAVQPVVVENTCSGFAIGKSTKAEVLNKCGEPFLHSESATGSELSFKLPGGSFPGQHTATFDFNGQGILIATSGS